MNFRPCRPRSRLSSCSYLADVIDAHRPQEPASQVRPRLPPPWGVTHPSLFQWPCGGRSHACRVRTGIPRRTRHA
eukprot:5765248-Heterocapsa_arctica.AAC.1